MALRPSQKLAQRHVETVADHAISNIEEIRRYATWIVYAVMGASYFHQFAYLFGTLHVREFWAIGTFEGDLHAATYAVGAALIPVIFDFFTIVCVKAISSVALKPWVRKLALALVLAPVGASGYINWNSSIGPKGEFAPAVAIIYLIVVAFIPLVELMRAASHEIDYPAIEKMELKALAQLDSDKDSAPVAPAKEMDPMEELVIRSGGEIVAARKLTTEYERMTPGQKQSWSRRFNNAKGRLMSELDDPAASVARSVKGMPVSPAVVAQAK